MYNPFYLSCIFYIFPCSFLVGPLNPSCLRLLSWWLNHNHHKFRRREKQKKTWGCSWRRWQNLICVKICFSAFVLLHICETRVVLSPSNSLVLTCSARTVTFLMYKRYCWTNNEKSRWYCSFWIRNNQKQLVIL